MFMRWQCRYRCESYVPQIAATPMKIIINEHDHFTLALAPSLASPVICVRSSNKEHVDQRNCSETIIIFWTNSFFVLLFRCCWLRCSTQCFVDVILFFAFLFSPYGHGAWCALFVDCGITSSTIYYWIFILGFSIDNNMCEYGFSLLFRFFFSLIRFITLIAQHLMFMCGTCFVFGFLVIFLLFSSLW